jgi:PTS system galactitol-specific IIA component
VNAILREEFILLRQTFRSSEEAIVKLSEPLQEKGYVGGQFAEAVLKRENDYPTGLPGKKIGIAIPHTDIRYVSATGIAVATLTEPVTFQSMGGSTEKVDASIIFLLAIHERLAQVDLLKQIMRLFRNDELLLNLATNDSKSEVLRLLTESLLPHTLKEVN